MDSATQTIPGGVPGLSQSPQINTQQTSQQLLTVAVTREQHNTFRLLLMMDQVARPTMQRVFFLGAPQKKNDVNLKDYLITEKGISRTKYREIFNKTFREKISSDSSCHSFDISLWLPAIQWGCNNLAPYEDIDTWINSPASLENHLKKIKDARNDLMHGGFSFSTHDFFAKVEEIRKLLVRTLELAQQKYSSDPNEMRQIISDLNTNISKIRDDPLNPMDFTAYENTPLTMELQNYLMVHGLKDLIDLFKEMVYINPSSTIMGRDIKLKIDIIFTELEMVIENRMDRDKMIDYTDLLKKAHEKKQKGRGMGQVILIEGIAGIGKTTILKLLLSGWASGDTSIKELDRYKFIIHMECKNSNFSSLSDLISLKMPRARKAFQSGNHMLEILMGFNLLIMVDGLDEMNSESKKIFQEILNIKRIENITVLCTTRPEKVQDYFQMVPDDVQTFHVKIKGVPEQRMEQFLFSYHEELRNTGDSQQDTQALLNYFKTTAACLKDHWRIPLNLSLLTWLWAVDPDRVNLVTTAIELYEQIYQLTLEKLIKRIFGDAHVLNLTELKKNVNVYISALSQEALIGLRDDAIIIKEKSVQYLKELCIFLNLPDEQTLGAFLIQENVWMTTCIISQSSFLHKGLQDYYACRSLYEHVTGSLLSDHDVNVEMIAKDIISCLSTYELPPHVCQDIIKSTSDKLKKFKYSSDSTIRSTLEHIYGQKLDPTILKKLQNVLVLLIGLMYQDENQIAERLSEELIELLKISGLDNDRDAWIRVLNSVNCNNHIVNLILQIPAVFTKSVDVSDTNVFAYATLLKVTHPKEVRIDIGTNPCHIPKLIELFQDITKHKCYVKDLSLEYIFRHSSFSLEETSIEDFIIQSMKRCPMKKYKGSVTAKMVLSKTINVLFASVSDEGSYETLHKFLSSDPLLMELRLCFNKGIDPTYVNHLKTKCLVLCLPDVENEEDIFRATETARRLQPTSKNESFSSLLFPRCSLTLEGQGDLVRKLEGVKVDWAVYFPANVSSDSPIDEDQLKKEKEKLKNIAKNLLQSKNGVIWGGYGIQDWDE